MGNVYIGDSASKARKLTNAYIGIDGVARKVKNIYVGVDGIARNIWSASPLKKYMLVEYGVSTNNAYRETFSVYDRTTNTTLNKLTTTGDTVLYAYSSPIAFSRYDASIVVCMTEVSRTITIYKKTSSGYSSIATINQTTLKSLTPNSGNTVFIHNTDQYQFRLHQNGMGVSADGKYMYCIASGKYLSNTSYSYNGCILIFRINENSISFVNSISFLSYFASSAGSIGEVVSSSSDDLSVISLDYYYVNPSYSSSSIQEQKCCIGDVTSTYTLTSFPAYYEDSSTMWSLISKISVSPDGNYVIYECQKSGYSNRITQPVKINKTNKTITRLVSLQTYNYLIYNFGFLGNDYYYMIIPTSNTTNSGNLLLRIYKRTGDNFTLTTSFNLIDPSTNTEFKAYESNSVVPLEAIGIDVENNTAVISTKNKYYICSFNGTNGAYNGYTVLTAGAYFSGQAKPSRIWLQ